MQNGQYNKKNGQYQYIFIVVVVSILTLHSLMKLELVQLQSHTQNGWSRKQSLKYAKSKYKVSCRGLSCLPHFPKRVIHTDNTQLDFPDFFKPHLDVIIHNYISVPLFFFFWLCLKVNKKMTCDLWKVSFHLLCEQPKQSKQMRFPLRALELLSCSAWSFLQLIRKTWFCISIFLDLTLFTRRENNADKLRFHLESYVCVS